MQKSTVYTRAIAGLALWFVFATQGVQAAGLLTPSDASVPPLELAEHHVDVDVEDGYAITRIEQVFANPHARDLEAVYSFPVPDKASVAEFTVWIDGQPVTGEVLEKKAARRAYEEEKQAGRDSGLAEQDGYKTFEIFVSPVRAGQDTRIRLSYYQPTHLDTGIGRYVYPLEEGGVDEAKLQFWTANDQVRDHFSFNWRIKSAYPVDAVRVPAQAGAVVTQIGSDEWQVRIDSRGHTAAPVNSETAPPPLPIPGQTRQQAFSLAKDLVVYWRLAPGLPGSVDLIAHKADPAQRGTFMLVVTPGDDLQPIARGSDWTFVLDISGSMQGKYATLVDGVQRSLRQMQTGDRFRIVLFNKEARELTAGFEHATPEAVERYSRELEQITPGSGTNLYAGLQLALKGLEAERTAPIVLVTDGVANVGETAQQIFLKLLERKDVRLFTFIMGNSANRPLLEALTDASGGFAISISNSDDIVGQLLLAASKVTHQALRGVGIEVEGLRTADLTPARVRSLYRGDQLVMFGHYWGSGEATLRVKGKIAGQEQVYTTRFNFPAAAHENPEIERLWAYAKIRDLQDRIDQFGEKADLKQAITDLGVEFGLVTDYTSMLVLRDEVYATRGIDRRNQRRLQVENAAQQARAQRPAQSRRVDTQQPMYQSSRPGLSGSGAVDGWWFLLLLPLFAVQLRRRPRAPRSA